MGGCMVCLSICVVSWNPFIEPLLMKLHNQLYALSGGVRISLNPATRFT